MRAKALPFQFRSVRAAAIGTVLFASSACGSDPTPATSDNAVSAPQFFGNASIEPPVTPAGFLVTLTPTAEVELICGEPASVHTTTDDFELLGILYPGDSGLWVPNSPDGIAVNACGIDPSSDPATYRVPDELVAGDYVVCRGFELDEAGCATFTIVPLAESANPDAVPLTTLAPEIPVPTDPPVTTPPSTDVAIATEAVGTGPVIVSQPSESAEQAAVEGTLSLREDCLLFTDSEVSAVVWPAGTQWDAANESVLSTSGDAIAMGQLITAGGGFHLTDTVGAFVTDPAAIDEVDRCATVAGPDAAILVIQSPVNV